MANPRNTPSGQPTYRRQRRKDRPDRAFVVINNKRMYLGEYGSRRSREHYQRIIAEWRADHLDTIAGDAVTVNVLCARFLRHAKRTYLKPDGSRTSTVDNYKSAIRRLREVYGSTPANEFGPRRLKAVRQRMIDDGWKRRVINQYVKMIRHIFKWGIEEEIISPTVYAALQAVAPLRRGRSNARESDRKLPVPDADIEAVRVHVSRQVWAMVQLQRYTGARGDEIVRLRPIDLDTSGKVWRAELDDHKTAYRERKRIIYFGPRAQQVIEPFLNRPTHAPMFSPREAIAEAAAQADSHRRPDQQPTKRKTKREVRETYTTASYRRAIERGCKQAGVQRWTPHRLRHNHATEVRAQFGVEASQVMLGHATVDVTEIYAERDEQTAMRIVAEVG